ncbi:MAG TPA: hypothetical protein VEX86_21120 [Longimicrobium sp.]|nr:hypothetical protein [Longimicrobium sp.]
MAKDTEAVAVAKLSGRQAIIVALITAIAGVIGILVTARSKPEPAVSQHWLRIESIDAQDSAPIRLIISVNGIYYSYPSTAAFLVPGPYIPHERFPVPPARDYAVSFRLLTPSGPVGESSQVDFVVSLPAEDRVYNLWTSRSVRGGSNPPPYKVRYSLR